MLEKNFTAEDSIKVLISSYLSNQASAEDTEALILWIGQSEENKKLFIEYKRAWELTLLATHETKFNKVLSDEWNKLSGNLDEVIKSESDNKYEIRILPYQRFLKIASVVLLFVTIGVTFAWRVSTKKLDSVIHKEISHEIIVPKGGRTLVILPDSTTVMLNACSMLRYNGDYGFNSRNIILEGEGYFTVNKNPDMPFIIEALGLKIKALGTIFNVKAYPDESSITTTLVEGVVKIESKGVNITMKPSQNITFNRNAHNDYVVSDETEGKTSEAENNKIAKGDTPLIDIKSGVNTQNYTAWKDNRLILNSEKLEVLSVLLERKFDVSVNIKSEELKNYRFSGTFYQETLEQILGVINLTAPIKYQIKDGIVTIQIDKNRTSLFNTITNNP